MFILAKELVYKLAITPEQFTLTRSQSKNWFEKNDAAINFTKHNNLKKRVKTQKRVLISTC